jgi:hypothetical protein
MSSRDSDNQLQHLKAELMEIKRDTSEMCLTLKVQFDQTLDPFRGCSRDIIVL